MIVRALDSNGDWTYGKGIQNYASGLLAVEQCIQTRLRSFLGDCFWAVNDGLDWNNLLSRNNQLGINLAVSACILNTSDYLGNRLVQSLEQVSVTVNSARNINIQYKISTIYGPITNGSLSLPITGPLVTEGGVKIVTDTGVPIGIGTNG